jgi:CRP-like cAMP-binding protein
MPTLEWPLLSPLPPAVRAKVIAATRARTYRRGEVVLREGEPGDTLHLVQAGRLAVRVSTESGESAILRILRPGDAFGELALLRRGETRQRSASITSLEDVTTLALGRAAFSSLCATYPQVERLLMALMAERIDQLSQRLIEALYVGVEKRIFRRLSELVDIYGVEGRTPVIPLTQDDVAGLAGTTRPTANQVLHRLAAQGILTLHRGNMEVNDVRALRRGAS